MLRRLLKTNIKSGYYLLHNYSQFGEEKLSENTHLTSIQPVDAEDYSLPKTKSVLEPLEEDISHISTYLKPTFNFAAYINKSETLQELLKLCVDLHKIESRHVDVVPFILSLKFADIKEHIIFLTEIGLEKETIGYIITQNPLILKEDVENLKIRINYLKFKKFTDEMILRIIGTNAFWLTHSTQQIDENLGFFQNYFKLSGNEVRLVTVQAPKLITHPIDKVKLKNFVLKEEMGFTEAEIKDILLHRPAIFLTGQIKLLQSFEYLHRDMNIPLERLVQEPDVLTCRKRRLMERHKFLVKLNKAQFEPKKPNYVALTSLVSGTDAHFSTEIAKSSIQAYNAFLKTL